MLEVSRLCIQPCFSAARLARRMSGKNAGKIDICFYHYCPANRSSKKRGWLRAFLIGASVQGRMFGSAGLLDGLHQGPERKISFRSCKRTGCPGAAGPEPGSSSPFQPNSCSLQVAFFPGSLCACWPALS